MNLIFFIHLEIAALLIVLIVLLLVIIWKLLRKHVVTVPSITLTVEKTQYDHGETVNVNGAVFSDGTTPAAGESVSLKLTDSAGDEFPVGSVTTDENGKYQTSFAVPDAVAPGGVTVTATADNMGVTATATFTLNNKHPAKKCPKCGTPMGVCCVLAAGKSHSCGQAEWICQKCGHHEYVR